MVSVCGYHCGENKEGKVLILISVEDGFCVIIAPKQTIKNKVLILISVEDGFCAIKNI